MTPLELILSEISDFEKCRACGAAEKTSVRRPLGGGQEKPAWLAGEKFLLADKSIDIKFTPCYTLV